MKSRVELRRGAEGPGKAEEGGRGNTHLTGTSPGCREPPPHGKSVPFRKRREEGKKRENEKIHTFFKISQTHSETPTTKGTTSLNKKFKPKTATGKSHLPLAAGKAVVLPLWRDGVCSGVPVSSALCPAAAPHSLPGWARPPRR